MALLSVIVRNWQNNCVGGNSESGVEQFKRGPIRWANKVTIVPNNTVA